MVRSSEIPPGRSDGPSASAIEGQHQERWTMTEVYCQACEEFTPLALEDTQKTGRQGDRCGLACVSSMFLNPCNLEGR